MLCPVGLLMRGWSAIAPRCHGARAQIRIAVQMNPGTIVQDAHVEPRGGIFAASFPSFGNTCGVRTVATEVSPLASLNFCDRPSAISSSNRGLFSSCHHRRCAVPPTSSGPSRHSLSALQRLDQRRLPGQRLLKHFDNVNSHNSARRTLCSQTRLELLREVAFVIAALRTNDRNP